MHKPIIAISTNHEQKKDFYNHTVIRNAYVNAVRIAGGLPILLPIQLDKNELRQILPVCDALIIPGGDDYHPAYYGQQIENESALGAFVL